jgi:ABC-type Fe3+ transport system substrate-binding protein
MVLAVIDGEIQPTVLSPASSLQAAILEDLSTRKFGISLVNLADESQCQPLVETPLILAAWQERAEALWGNDPGASLWEDLREAAIDPQGWGAYGHPDWGFFKFGHTNPLKSNSGFMTTILLAYEYHQKSSDLTTGDIQDPDFQDWFLDLESAITEFGDSTGSYMRDIIAYGPSKYDMVAVYESVAIEQAENAVGRYGELNIYYPPRTLMSDHPYCILKADWVTSEQAEAAQLFMTYLLSEPAQEAAVMQYGFRSVNPAIALDQPGSPFLTLADNGIKISNLPPEVEIPKGAVLDTLLDFWARQVE